MGQSPPNIYGHDLFEKVVKKTMQETYKNRIFRPERLVLINADSAKLQFFDQ